MVWIVEFVFAVEVRVASVAGEIVLLIISFVSGLEVSSELTHNKDDVKRFCRNNDDGDDDLDGINCRGCSK